MNHRKLPIAAGAALLAALLVAGYSSSRHGDFQFDDTPAVADNMALKNLDAFVGTIATRSGALGRPLTELTFAVDYWRAGLDPVAFHTTSLAIHLAAVALAFLFVRETLRRAGRERGDGLALAVAGLWGLHPLQSQAVSYIVQRSEALASALYLAALLLLLAAWRHGRKADGVVLYVAGLVLFGLGLQAKLIVVTLPAAFLLHIALLDAPSTGEDRGRRWRARLLATAPLLAVSVLAAAGTMVGLRGHQDAGFDVPRAITGNYALSQLRAVWRYLSLLAWPAGQNVDHDFAPSLSLLQPPSTLLAGAALAALLAAAGWLLVRSYRPGRDPALAATERLTAFGIAWFLVILSPTSSFVPLADHFMEHRAYLASLGVVLAAAAWGELLLARLVAPSRRAAAGAAAVLILWGALAATLHARNRVWLSPMTLWTDARDKAPGKFRTHYNLGHSLGAIGDDQGALAEYVIASGLPTADPLDPYRLRRNMGATLLFLGRLDEAIAVLTQALSTNPASPELHNNLALAWLRKGDLARAEEHATLAIRFAPSYGQSYNTLGEIRAGRGDLPGALAAFSAGSRLMPDLLPALENVAIAQEQLGLLPDACATWSRYAVIRGGEGRGKAAERRARLGCGATP